MRSKATWALVTGILVALAATVSVGARSQTIAEVVGLGYRVEAHGEGPTTLLSGYTNLDGTATANLDESAHAATGIAQVMTISCAGHLEATFWGVHSASGATATIVVVRCRQKGAIAALDGSPETNFEAWPHVQRTLTASTTVVDAGTTYRSPGFTVDTIGCNVLKVFCTAASSGTLNLHHRVH